MSNRLLHGPRFSIGSQAPVWPYVLNRDSDQARNLTLWLPGDLLTAARVTDLGLFGLHGTPNSFEASWEGVNDFGGRGFDLNSGGASDADKITIAADPRIAINSNPFTFVLWGNFQSYGLGGFTEFGRILEKGSGLDFRFDAATGPFGAGANTRLLLDRTTGGTTQQKAGGSNAEVPLNSNIQIALTHDGGLGHAGVHIYTNAQEITYTVETDGTGGPFTSDTSADALIGDRAGGDRLVEGLVWDIRLYNRALSPREIWALYDPQTRFELFEEEHIPRVWPSLGTVASSVNASLQSALRRQASLLASVEAALRAELILAAAADAALAHAFFGAADLDAAAQAIRTAQADLDAALRRTLERGAGLDANLTGLGLSQRSAALDSAVRRLNTQVASLQAALGTEAQGAAQFDAMLAFEVLRFAGLDTVTQLGGRLSESVFEAALRATGSRAAALDAIVGLVAAAAAGRTFDVTANRSHGVAALGRRAAIPSGKRRH